MKDSGRHDRKDAVWSDDAPSASGWAHRAGRPLDPRMEAAAWERLALTVLDPPGRALDELAAAARRLCGAEAAGVAIAGTPVAFDGAAATASAREVCTAAADPWWARLRASLESDGAQALCGPLLVALPDRGSAGPPGKALLVPMPSTENPAAVLWAAARQGGASFDAEALSRMTRLAGLGARLLPRRPRGAPPESAGPGLAPLPDTRATEGGERCVRNLLARRLDAVEDERRRIARELHDTLGQSTCALDLGLEAALGDASMSDALRARLLALQQTSRRIGDEVDRLARGLRPAALDELPLPDAMRRHAESWAAESGIALDLRTQGLRSLRLAPRVEGTIYRVMQESLTNVRKHAHATHVSLIVERRGGQLRLIVEDDGCGFDASAQGHRTAVRRRLGLRGMHERAALAGGRLEIESSRGGGTTVYLTIPLADGQARADADVDADTRAAAGDRPAHPSAAGAP